MNNMATTESDIVNMAMRLAGTGHQVGLTEAQIMSFAAALSSVGIEAEAGGTAFSKVMTDMQLATESGGKKLDNFAKVAGMSASQFKQAFKQDASQAIIAFIQGLGNMQKHGKSAIGVLNDMGIKDVRVRDTLLRASGASGVFTNALKIGNDAWKENTALTNEANQRYQTTASKIAMLKNNFIDLGITIFQKFEQPLKQALDIAIKNIQELQKSLSSSEISSSLDKIAQGFSNLIVIVSELAKNILPSLINVLGWILSHGSGITATIVGIVTAIKTFKTVNSIISSLEKMQKAWNTSKLAVEAYLATSKMLAETEGLTIVPLTLKETIVGLLTGKLKLATVAQRLFNIAVKENPIGFFVSAIMTLIAVFATLWATSESFRNFWIGLWHKITSLVSQAVNSIKTHFAALGITLSEIGHKIGSAFTSMGHAIQSIFKLLEPLLVGIANKAKEAWRGFIEVLEKIKEKFAFLGPIVGKISSSIIRSFTTARGIALTFVGVLANIGLRFLGLSGPIGIVASLLITLSTSFLKISGFSAEGITKTFNDLGNKISQVGDILAKNLPKFIEAGTKIIVNIIDGITKNIPKLIDTASKIITNITNGIAKTLPKIIEAGTKIIDSFADTISKSLPKLIDSGTKILDRLVQGITNAIPKLINLATKVITTYVDFITKNLPKLIDTGTKILNKLIEGITKALPKLIDLATKAITSWINAISKALPKIIDAGIKIIDKLVQGITNAIPKLANLAIKVVTTYIDFILKNLPKIIDAGIKIIDSLIQGITNAIPKILPVIIGAILLIVTNIIKNLPKILEAGAKIILALIAGIGLVIGKLALAAIKIIFELVKAILKALPQIIAAGVKLILALIKGIAQMLPTLVIAAVKIIFALVKALITNLPKILAAGVKILLALIKGIMQIIPQLALAALKIIFALVKALIVNLPKILEAGVKLVLALIKGIGSMAIQLALLGPKLILQLVIGIGKGIVWVVEKGIELGSKFVNAVISWFCQLPGKIWNWLVSSVGKISEWGGNIYNKAIESGSRFISGIISWFCQLPGRIWNWLINSITKIGQWESNIYNKAISAGSKFISGVIRWFCQLPGKIWTWLVNSIGKVASWGGNLASKGAEAAGKLVSAVVNTAKSIPGKMLEIGSNIVQGVWNGITGAAGWFSDKVSGFFGGIVDKAKGALGIHSPSRVMAAQVGKWIPPGIGQGIKDSMPELDYQMNEQMIGLTSKMRATVSMQSDKMAKRFYNNNSYTNNSRYVNNNQSVTQNITFNKPIESPVETARRIKQVGRSLVFG